MTRCEELREELRHNYKRRRATIVIYSIVNLWIVCLCLVLSLPVLMSYCILITSFILVIRLKKLQHQRVKLEAEISVAESEIQYEDLAMIWQSYADVRAQRRTEYLERSPEGEENSEIDDTAQDMVDEEAGEGHENEASIRPISRPRGPHLSRSVRPPPHNGIEWDAQAFTDNEDAPEMNEGGIRADHIEILRRDFRALNVASFNRVPQLLSVRSAF